MKVLLDSNIIIYSAISEYAFLHKFLKDKRLYVSAISYLEVLGFDKLSEKDRKYFELFFNEISIIPIDNSVLIRAVKLKQQKKITLGDSIVAASCLINKLPLITRNSDDYDWINTLKIINPFDAK